MIDEHDDDNQDLGLHLSDDELDDLEEVNAEMAKEAAERKKAKSKDPKPS